MFFCLQKIATPLMRGSCHGEIEGYNSALEIEKAIKILEIAQLIESEKGRAQNNINKYKNNYTLLAMQSALNFVPLQKFFRYQNHYVMKKKFNEYSKFNLSEINKEVLSRWNEEKLFEQSMKVREGNPSFVFYEGPPSANGMPGIHHVMARTIKDIYCRYKTVKGFHVKRKAGWDTHGLPVELGVEKALGITKEDIGKKISVDE